MRSSVFPGFTCCKHEVKRSKYLAYNKFKEMENERQQLNEEYLNILPYSY